MTGLSHQVRFTCERCGEYVEYLYVTAMPSAWPEWLELELAERNALEHHALTCTTRRSLYSKVLQVHSVRSIG